MLFQSLRTHQIKPHLQTIDQFHCYQSSARSLKDAYTQSYWITLRNIFQFSSRQWGYQLGSRPQLHWLLYTVHISLSYLHTGKDVAIVFFDFKKAFDSVLHRQLLDKLHQLKCHSHTFADRVTYQTYPKLWLSTVLHHSHLKFLVESHRAHCLGHCFS